MYRLLCPQRFFVDVSVDVSVGVGVDVDVDVDRPNRRTTRDELATKPVSYTHLTLPTICSV